MTYTNAPIVGTRRGAFGLSAVMFLLVSSELAMRYVRHAHRPLAEEPAALLLFLYTFVPLGVALWLFTRLGEFEALNATPTHAMRQLYFVALSFGVFGYLPVFIAERFFLP